MTGRPSIAETGDGGAAAIIASALLVAMIIVAFFFYVGLGGEASTTIQVSAPLGTVTAAPSGSS
jgi:hypothetical protein